jgi:predicted nucleic acid-binding protein
MRAVLDACVLVPPILREILLAVAARGLFEPCWSERILEEWARASAKFGPTAEAEVRLRIAFLRAAFPRACLPAAPGVEGRIHLPDMNDAHVLAVAIAGSADAIITVNAVDFPRHILAEDKIARRDPDGFLWELWSGDAGAVEAAIAEVQAEASRRDGAPVALKGMLKRARLNRLARAMGV